MRITITIDDALYQKALELADPQMDKANLFSVAVSTFVRLQAGKRLAALGGAAPEMANVPRQRDALEYDEFLAQKVEAGRASMHTGSGQSNDEVEAAFVARRASVKGET